MAVLVLVVYATLLRPTGPDTPGGIEGPGGGQTTIEPGAGGGTIASRGPDDRSRRSGSVVSPPTGAVGAAAADGADGPGPDAVAPPSPPDDQYDDAVEALRKRIGASRSIPD